MKWKMAVGIILIVFMISTTTGCLKEEAPTTTTPTETTAPVTNAPAKKAPVTTAPAAKAVINAELVAAGGRLYDKWYKELGLTTPTEDQALWAQQVSNTRGAKDNWRCKECHGWDYKGKDGAYASGSHMTGFSGVFDAATTKTADELKAAMKGKTNPDHDFTSALGDANIENLVLFMKNGLIDQGMYIDYDTKKPIGANIDNGKKLYGDTCHICHGDGTWINFGSKEDPVYISDVANDNPWETLHKIRAGQPGSEPPMPSAIVSGWSIQDAVDVLGYSQTLIKEEEAVVDNSATIAAGGRLYDKWYKELGLTTPTEDQALWAQQVSNTRGAKDNWRCKECHGWDYKGKDGAYASGSHMTGFSGVFDAAAGKSAEDLAGILEGTANPDHDFSAVLDHEALHNLATFLSEGLIDDSEYIDYDTKKPKSADETKGKELYEKTCTLCHGEDGKTLNFGSKEDPVYISDVANDNPWETLHKIRAGQPGSEPPMPSAIVSGWSIQDAVDVLGYSQTL